MKVVNDNAVLTPEAKHHSHTAYYKAVKFVEQIWDKLRSLAGEDKGIIIDLKESETEVWPTIQQYSDMNAADKKSLRFKLRGKLIYVIYELRRRRHPRFKYDAFFSYVGNGCVILAWKYLKKGRRKPDETAD